MKKRIMVFIVISVMVIFTGCQSGQHPQVHSIEPSDPVDGIVSSAAAYDKENASDSQDYSVPLDFYEGEYNDTALIILKHIRKLQNIHVDLHVWLWFYTIMA